MYQLLFFTDYKIISYCAINIQYPGTKVYDNHEEFSVKAITDDFDNYTMGNDIIETDIFTPNDL